MFNFLWLHGLKYARLLCLPLSPGVCSNSCPLNQWCHAIISSSVTPFSFCHQSFPESRSFTMKSALPIRGPKYWSLTNSPSSEYSGEISLRVDWINLLAVQGTLESLLQHHNLKASILPCSAFFMIQLSHRTWLLEKPWLWLYRALLAKWYLCFLI